MIFKTQEATFAHAIWLSGGATPAPMVTERHGKWHEFIIPIGNDEAAHVTMTDDALRALCERNGMSHNLLSQYSRSTATKSTETTND